jgi:adenine-specific DNA-methyltransferase
MARKQRTKSQREVGDYRHDEARRKNNPPAGIAPTYEVRERRTTSYAYDPHLDPQLQWAGKAEHTSFDVDVVSLHIHERISTRAILDAVRRPEPLQLSLFGETPLPAHQQIEFYQHEVGWVNRLVLGDSLLVMNSLLVKEGMAGKVQMIYVDPPYGIKYASNFQPRLDRRDVKDQDTDLTREPEQIKAYRDTWKLGTHSYLTYLRDRLLLARDLLTESGSIFVQINDENLHLVRSLLDEVFGQENFVGIIAFRKKTGPLGGKFIQSICDYLLWYARNKEACEQRFRKLFDVRSVEGDAIWGWVELPDGNRRRLTRSEVENHSLLPDGSWVFRSRSLSPAGFNATAVFDFEFEGRTYPPPRRAGGASWTTGREGMQRLADADRLIPIGQSLDYVYYHDDFPLTEIANIWAETRGAVDKLYSVQTDTSIIERCILMTTDPGDLVFDPTCGSGTTAYCAEKWGRRWITCDTSRVALAIARQRLMTAKYDYYELVDPERGPAGGFIYDTVPHITLESIAKNTEIDAIAAKYQSRVDEALAELNRALGKGWKEWEVPRELPPTRPPPWAGEEQQTPSLSAGRAGEGVKEAHEHFWSLKLKKRQEIDASIQRNAPQETLHDQPQAQRGVVRVSGPFTVEAIPVPAVEDPTQVPIPQFEEEEARARVSDRGGDYLTTMLNLLKQQGGVLFPGGKKMELQSLRLLNLGMLHAEGETPPPQPSPEVGGGSGRGLRVAVSFGPQHGPVTAFQVQEAIPTARMNAYNVLIFAGFSFDPEAQALIQKAPVAGLQMHFANIAPDVLVGDLLKTTRASQIFTVFGQPDVALTPAPSPASGRGEKTYIVELRGVDIYDPLTGETQHAHGSDVAAWFLDTDYDGMAFHICQALFAGDADAWDKLQRALKASIDAEAFEQMRGTVSFPFQPGEHQRIAVKVIDFRGNEVVRVVPLGKVVYEAGGGELDERD